jgi:hypothetical protein
LQPANEGEKIQRKAIKNFRKLKKIKFVELKRFATFAVPKEREKNRKRFEAERQKVRSEF